MQNQIQLSAAGGENRNDIISLLQEEKLPVEDLPPVLKHFLIATDDGEQLAGTIGLERHGNYGLLRSMAVNKKFRNQGIASMLVNKLEQDAKERGIQTIYLLTETAADYFERKGYVTIGRDEVPDEIKASTEFSNVCPVSAAVMMKPIAADFNKTINNENSTV